MRMFQIASTVLCLCVFAEAQVAEYQVNGPSSSMTLNGVVGTHQAPAVSFACSYGPVNAVVTSPHVGLGYEVVISPSALIPASGGAIVTPGGQLVNVDIHAMGTWYLWGGPTFDFSNAFPSSSLTVSFDAPGAAGSTGYQAANVAPSAVDGFALSQGCQLEVGTSLPVPPQGDDTSVMVSLGACVGHMPFYGTVYTELSVSSNGRIVFGAADNDFSPSIPEALNGDPFFGFWADLNPVLSGSITLDIPSPGQLRSTWNSVPYYAEWGTPVSFSLIIDTVTGSVSMSGLTGIAANPINNTTIPSNDTQFLGMSMGAGATDAGPTLFLPGMSGSLGSPTDMIYDWFDGLPGGDGRAPSLASGLLSDLTFSPAGSSYVWSGSNGNAAPQLTSMSPTTSLTEAAPFTLSVTGSSFVNASVIRWNGAPLPTTFVSTTQLDAAVDTALLGTAETAVVTVFTPQPGGGSTAGLPFQILHPLPVISSLAPAMSLTGSAPFLMTVTGSGFVTSSVVEWGGVPLPTTYVSATQLYAAVDTTHVGVAGTVAVAVATPAPGGGTSATLPFQIDNPVPVLTSMLPNTSLTGGGPFTLTVTGTGFVSDSVVHWNGSPLSTTFVSSTRLDATVTSGQVATAGTATVTVSSPTPGGGTSSGLPFQVDHPMPVLMAMTPGMSLTGVGPFIVSVTGTGFVSGSVVRWNNAPLSTTFVSATQLNAMVPPGFVVMAGTASVTVFSPAPGGGTTPGAPFQVDHPIPVLTSMSPTTALTGAAPFTLTVTGTDYVTGSVVHWNGAPLATTFVSATQLDATVDTAQVTTAGAAIVTVFSPTPGGGSSAGLAFQVDHPVPVLTSMSPTMSLTGVAPFTLTVTGTDYVTGSVVHWNGAPLATTYVSATRLDATVDTTQVATAGTATVTVFTPTPGGGTTAGLPFQVDHPVPVLTSMSPTTALTGAAPFTLTVIGTDYVAGSVVHWDGAPLVTTFVSATQLDALVDTTQVATAGTATVTVFTPIPGGGTTAGLPFQVDHPVPVLASMSATTAFTGAAPFTLTVTGASYVTGSVVHWNGAPLATTYVSATRLDALVDATQVAVAGTATVTVFSPAPGGGTTAGLTFQVDHPIPVLTSMSPTTALTGAAPFTLTVTGTDYVTGSVVHWNGAPLTTTFVSATQLDATVDTAQVVTAGTAIVTVFSPTPGGGTSTGLAFQLDHPVPVLTSMSPTTALTGATPFTLTVTGTDYVTGSVVHWNGAPLATTYVSATQLDATVGTAQVAIAGAATVTVFSPTPGGGASAGLAFQLDHPVPVLTSMSPTTALTGASPFALTVIGTDYVTGSVVHWNGAPLATTYVSATQLDAVVDTTQVATAGTATVTVFSPTPGGGTTVGLPFQVDHPVPAIGTVAPTSVVVGSPTTGIVVTGSQFVATSEVRFNGTPLATTWVSANQLTASVPGALLGVAGGFPVTVSTPAPGGGVSSSQPFDVRAPTITSASISSIPVQLSGFTPIPLTVSGADYLPTSVVYANGTPLTTTYVNAGQLDAVLDSQVQQVFALGAMTINVANTPHGVSNTSVIRVGPAAANQGTIRTVPPAPAPGQTYTGLVEGASPSGLISILADGAPGTPILEPAIGMVIGIGPWTQGTLLAGLSVVVDGLGLLGGADGTTLDATGTLVIPGAQQPAPPQGWTIGVQAVYTDPSAPLGLRLTWARWPLGY